MSCPKSENGGLPRSLRLDCCEASETTRVSPESVAESGAAMGGTSAIVAHDEPVENATKPDRTKMMNGSAMLKSVADECDECEPVPKSSQTFLIAHAVKIAAASSVFMPER